MSKTTDEVLNDLHTKLAEVLYTEVTSDEVNASILNVARQFLKDNRIEGAAAPGTPVRKLAEVLPFEIADEQ